MPSLTPEKIQQFLLFLPVILLSVAIHEFAHCWTTDRLGDDTPRSLGRVTLNPLKHLDPLGTFMMVASAIAGFGIGWGKPSPMTPANFRHPERGRMISAAAGPFSNILQMLAWASLAALIVQCAPHHNLYASFLVKLSLIGVYINATLAMFNLLPIYPLDGHHILSYLAPPAWRPIIDNPAWMYVFLAIVLVPQLNTIFFDHFLQPATFKVFGIALSLVGLQ